MNKFADIFLIQSIPKSIMDFLSNLANFFLEAKQQPSKKIMLAIALMVLIYVVNNVTGLSFFYENSRKIEEVQQLNAIIHDSTSDVVTRLFAIELRKEVVNRKNMFEQLGDFLFPNQTQLKGPLLGIRTDNMPVPKDNTWFRLTSSGISIILAVLVFVLIVFQRPSSYSIWMKIAFGLFPLLFTLGIGILSYALCTLIPQLSISTWIWNYLLNVVVQIICLSPLAFVASTQQK